MQSKRIEKEFFETHNALEIAPFLVGKLVCCNLSGQLVRLRITETESYCGIDDTACHAHKGRTKRTEILYGAGGVAYIYLCYGIHSLLNVVAGAAQQPEAVLIRCCEGYEGPGKLTKALGLTHHHNGEDLGSSQRLWLEDDGFACTVAADVRVGIGYAAENDRLAPWRFVIDTPKIQNSKKPSK